MDANSAITLSDRAL